MAKALITGVTGQDGSYLAEFLLGKGYDVFGVVRRSSTENKFALSFADFDISENALHSIFVDYRPHIVGRIHGWTDFNISGSLHESLDETGINFFMDDQS